MLRPPTSTFLTSRLRLLPTPSELQARSDEKSKSPETGHHHHHSCVYDDAKPLVGPITRRQPRALVQLGGSDKARGDDGGPAHGGQDAENQQALLLVGVVTDDTGGEAGAQDSVSARGAAVQEGEDGERPEVAAETPDQERFEAAAEGAENHRGVEGAAVVTVV